jgi:hypothetical protein
LSFASNLQVNETDRNQLLGVPEAADFLNSVRQLVYKGEPKAIPVSKLGKDFILKRKNCKRVKLGKKTASDINRKSNKYKH